ncbi:MAG TPA: cytidylate kinase-like family protein [Candidatus Binatia bacterium]|jgi:cytidylate kinase
MSLRTICISLTQESGGEAIGHAVAETLGYRFVDEEIISKAAELASVEPERVIAAEQQQPLMQRLLDRLPSATAMVESLVRSGRATTGPPVTGDELREIIREAIHEIADIGNVVIVAHAASIALAGKPGVLRVLVTAPEETRIDRLAESRLLTRVNASLVITESDIARRGYFQSFYRIEDEQPTLYDLVINTEVLTTRRATEIILAAVRD